MNNNGQTVSNQSGLDAASQAWGYRSILYINIVCASLSLVGALVMIIPFFLSPQLRKVRHRMILGLAVNDLVQALTVLVPTIYVFSGERHLRTDSPGCTADSFFYLALVVSGCLWALAIAISTYLTLVHPLSRMSRWLHYTWAMPAIWAGIWLFSFVNSAKGTALVPSIDAGGFCFFPSIPPNYYGNLIIFIPRTLVFIIVIVLYARLFFFFRRQSSRAKSIEGHLPSPALDRFPSSSNAYEKPMQDGVSSRPDNAGRPVYRVNSLQFNLAQYSFRGSRKGSQDSQLTMDDDIGGRRRSLVKGAPQIAQAIPEASEDSPILVQDSDAILHGHSGFEQQLVMLEALPSRRPSAHPASPRMAAASPALQSQQSQQSYADGPWLPDTSSYRFPAIPAAVKSQSADRTEQGKPCITTEDEVISSLGPLQSPSEVSTAQTRSDSRPHYQRIDLQKTDTGTTHKTLGGSSEIENDMGLWEALDAVAPQGDKANPNGGYGSGGRRMSASEENKRVSYLMIMYPLAYALIVAVSVARTLATLVTGLPSSPVLQIMNRVLVMSIGFVDAIIYSIVEWRFRAATRAASR